MGPLLIPERCAQAIAFHVHSDSAEQSFTSVLTTGPPWIRMQLNIHTLSLVMRFSLKSPRQRVRRMPDSEDASGATGRSYTRICGALSSSQRTSSMEP